MNRWDSAKGILVVLAFYVGCIYAAEPSCSAPAVYEGETGTITFYFNEELSPADAILTVDHYRSSKTRTPEPVVECHPGNGNTSKCLVHRNYALRKENSVSSPFIVEIRNATLEVAGDYELHKTLSLSRENVISCRLEVKERLPTNPQTPSAAYTQVKGVTPPTVEASTEGGFNDSGSAAAFSENSLSPDGTAVAVVVVVVAIVLIVALVVGIVYLRKRRGPFSLRRPQLPECFKRPCEDGDNAHDLMERGQGQSPAPEQLADHDDRDDELQGGHPERGQQQKPLL